MKKVIKIMVVCMIICMMTGCGKSEKAAEQKSEEQSSNKESSGTEKILPLDNTEFYMGTWKGLFYYDPENDKMESMEDDGSKYVITFSKESIIVSAGDSVMSANVTTSDGIQHNNSGTDYYCLYYKDTNTNKDVTMALMMMNITGEQEAGLDDGDYLTVMSSDNPNQYMFFEKVNEQ